MKEKLFWPAHLPGQERATKWAPSGPGPRLEAKFMHSSEERLVTGVDSN